MSDPKRKGRRPDMHLDRHPNQKGFPTVARTRVSTFFAWLPGEQKDMKIDSPQVISHIQRSAQASSLLDLHHRDQQHPTAHAFHVLEA